MLLTIIQLKVPLEFLLEVILTLNKDIDIWLMLLKSVPQRIKNSERFEYCFLKFGSVSAFS